jgi:hypothetical protein
MGILRLTSALVALASVLGRDTEICDARSVPAES